MMSMDKYSDEESQKKLQTYLDGFYYLHINFHYLISY